MAQRFPQLDAANYTPRQKEVADAIQSGPRGGGLRGPFNALLRSPELCDLVQRVGGFRIQLVVEVQQAFKIQIVLSLRQRARDPTIPVRISRP